jgi:RNA polymerase sigma-70 factor, ECF subfamily
VTDLRTEAGFARAYREHRARVYSVALAVVHDHAAADDVAQEVFAQLWRKPDAFDARRSSLPTYLSLLARSRALDYWRSRAARGSAEDRVRDQVARGPASDESAADAVERSETTRGLVEMLRTLPGEQLEAVLLAYGHGMTGSEIASSRGVPVGTAKSRIRLALKKARALTEVDPSSRAA